GWVMLLAVSAVARVGYAAPPPPTPSSTPLGTRPTLEEVRHDMARPSHGTVRGRIDSTAYAFTADQMAKVWERSLAGPAPDTFGVAPAPRAALIICPQDDCGSAGRVSRRVIPRLTARTVVLVGVFHRYRRFAEHDRVVFDAYSEWTAPDGQVPVSSLRNALLKRLPRADWTQDTTAHD